MFKKTGFQSSIVALTLAVMTNGTWAGDPKSCQKVTFSDTGWAELAVTNTMASVVLEGLGYKPKSQFLSLPVTFVSLKNKDVDVFLGNWMPTQKGDIKKYLDDGSIEVLQANLKGARSTLAVPQFVADAGLRNFTDIAKFRDKLRDKIYGIEPGNGANRQLQKMIDGDELGLKGFEVVVSSEQGMLSQVKRAVRRGEWIVFLGWEPHPMNTEFDLVYLGGGDKWFGQNFGGANVFTDVRKNYVKECPNAGRLVSHLSFTLAMENEIMAEILDQGLKPEKAVTGWLRAHPDVFTSWLDGVTTFDGKDGLSAVKAHLGL